MIRFASSVLLLLISIGFSFSSQIFFTLFFSICLLSREPFVRNLPLTYSQGLRGMKFMQRAALKAQKAEDGEELGTEEDEVQSFFTHHVS